MSRIDLAQLLQANQLQARRIEIALDRLATLLEESRPLYYVIDEELAARYAMSPAQLLEICKRNGLVQPHKGRKSAIHRRDRDRLDGIVERMRKENAA